MLRYLSIPKSSMYLSCLWFSLHLRKRIIKAEAMPAHSSSDTVLTVTLGVEILYHFTVEKMFQRLKISPEA